MTKAVVHTGVEKVATGISSFDIIAKGGLPRNRTTLISGTAGSGKTIFAVQFLAAGIQAGTPGVFVTFEESATDIRKNMLSFGWDLAAWEAEGKLAFVDASPDPLVDTIEAGGKAADTARKALRDDLTRNASAFKASKFFLSPEISLADCALAPLIWRLGSLGVQLPREGQPIIDYGERIFRSQGFARSMTADEKSLRP